MSGRAVDLTPGEWPGGSTGREEEGGSEWRAGDGGPEGRTVAAPSRAQGSRAGNAAAAWTLRVCTEEEPPDG